MISPVSNSAPPVSAPAPKPWAFGDPSSFEQLFSPILSGAAAPAKPAATAAPVLSPAAAAPFAPFTPFTFEQDATVTGYGTSTPMNPEELATADTANRLAKMLGGEVTADPAYGGGFSNSTPTRNITFKDAHVTMNAGITAYLFNTYGDKPGSQAWQQINKMLGRELMSTT